MKLRDVGMVLALYRATRMPSDGLAGRAALLALVVALALALVQAADRDTCARYGRLTDTETRYEATLVVLPGECWVRFPEAVTWTRVDWTEAG